MKHQVDERKLTPKDHPQRVEHHSHNPHRLVSTLNLLGH